MHKLVYCRYTVVLYSTYIDITSYIIDIITLIYNISYLVQYTMSDIYGILGYEHHAYSATIN